MNDRYDNIKLKRVYDAPVETDGTRLLADRLWPRGVKKSQLKHDQWIKVLCPSDTLRKSWHQHAIEYEEFKRRYVDELHAQETALNTVAKLAENGTVTLLSAAKQLDSSHLPILKQHILMTLEANDVAQSDERASAVCYQKD